MVAWLVASIDSAFAVSDAFGALSAGALGPREAAEVANEAAGEGHLDLMFLLFWLRFGAVLGIAAALMLGVVAYGAKQQRELPLIIAGLAVAAAAWCMWMSLGLIPDH